jgi:N-hydroxyarylamine O-acetyltransferase
MFDLAGYLNRIGLGKPVQANAQGLARLQRAQLKTIPFENLDIHLGRIISLEGDAVFDKLVTRRRGGYCFELNALFAQALYASGFIVRSHLARVIYGRDAPGGRTHHVLIAEAEGRAWLADVGFGGPGLRAPIPLDPGLELTQDSERFALRAHHEHGYLLEKEIDGRWTPLYVFAAHPELAVDFEMGNFYMSQHPQSYFRRNRVVALQRPHGRVSLTNFTLTVDAGRGNSTSTTIESGEIYMAALREHFGIVLEQRYEDFLPLPD